jgi:hypothetical protein
MMPLDTWPRAGTASVTSSASHTHVRSVLSIVCSSQ